MDVALVEVEIVENIEEPDEDREEGRVVKPAEGSLSVADGGRGDTL